MDKKSVSIMTVLCILIFVLFGIIVIDAQKSSDDHSIAIKADVQEDADHDVAAVAEKQAVAKPKAHAEKAVAKKDKATEKKAAAPTKAAQQPEPKKIEAKALPAGKTEVADVIMMENPAYAKHKKGIVKFTHNAHIEDYELACGECHHDSKGKPLTLKMGDPVQNCIVCHTKPSKKTRDAKTKAQKLEFHAEALHMNCIGCHKAYNKDNGTKAAPAGCGKCHPKK
jgi:lipopolysaccharide export system protein LptA